MQANASRRPFAARALNDIESMSLATQIVTIYCGIFFISSKDINSDSFNKNKDFHLDENSKIFFFGVIAFCNVSFVILWVTKFVVTIRVLIKEKYPTIYVYLFLCGRKDKMPLEVAKRARDVKKEAIIESIEAVVLYMSKMKGLYISNICYEDHNRFLRLLYYIESERVQIDVTEKLNNYYIQGEMARHRRFDPERLEEAKDLKELRVEGNFIKEMEAMTRQKPRKRGKTFISSLSKTRTSASINVVALEPPTTGV